MNRLIAVLLLFVATSTANAKPPVVIVYTDTSCPPCELLKRHEKAGKLKPYEFKFVQFPPSITRVPTIEYRGRRRVGYDYRFEPEGLKAWLDALSR